MDVGFKANYNIYNVRLNVNRLGNHSKAPLGVWGA